MVMTDPVADMLTRIRNAGKARHEACEIPSSKLKIRIAEILKQEGYIKSFRFLEDSRQGILKVVLRYDEEGEHVIKCIKRASKPGLRRYVSKDTIPKVLDGLGVAVISTPQGLMSDKSARAQGVGGEVLCTVY
ncbi:MAG: 30S ribosomal protein S8 [Candidatus Alcyoniella australis]|nr:30S ribosomal protein S8 [Candidatus Alcyoniella australis]